MEFSPTTWQDVQANTRICPVCALVITEKESSLHLSSHISEIVEKRSITPVYDVSYFSDDITVLYICGYCNFMPPPRTGKNQADDIYSHLEYDCPVRKADELKSYKWVTDVDTIRDIVAAMEHAKPLDLWFCRNYPQGFSNLHLALTYFQKTKLTSPSKQVIREKELSGLVSEEVKTLLQHLSEDEPQATVQKKPQTPSSHSGRKILSVPHPRSILKTLAGIVDEAELTPKSGEEDEEESLDHPPLESQGSVNSPKYIKKELRYTNIVYGHINLTSDVESLLNTSENHVLLVSEEGREFVAEIDRDRRLLWVGSSLSDWFQECQIVAGCYVYLQRTEDQNRIEIDYVPIETVVKKCLIATWDENERRVRLRYANVTVHVECSEHLFRSSVNLDDPQVLEYMARLHGSIFDVLYLGMRDLAQAGNEVVHYRDLHNMVIDKRLHPQLGSVFVELSKNRWCFGKLGNGNWYFIPDPRIERILPGILKTTSVHDDNSARNSSEPNIIEPLDASRKATAEPPTALEKFYEVVPSKTEEKEFPVIKNPTVTPVEKDVEPTFGPPPIAESLISALEPAQRSNRSRLRDLVKYVRDYLAGMVKFLRKTIFGESGL
jgi:hypothetical protein